jgi:hypothetical protein
MLQRGAATRVKHFLRLRDHCGDYEKVGSRYLFYDRHMDSSLDRNFDPAFLHMIQI